MATLWRAMDEQLDREVAVKLLRPQFGNDPGFAARFKQEARSAGSLSHPNIVSVYDYGTDAETGGQFIVMQLVDGEDLAAILKKNGPLQPDDAVRIAIGVASALEAAHRRGIVHRDVKPGNILIDQDVKVTDFGIARAVAEASMTVTGTTLGSVHYFSPEQARGDEVTGQSDVYALGIVLYEMLTGRRPFEGDSAAGVALKRLSEDPLPPTVHGPVPPGPLGDRDARPRARPGQSLPRCRGLRRGAAGLAARSRGIQRQCRGGGRGRHAGGRRADRLRSAARHAAVGPGRHLRHAAGWRRCTRGSPGSSDVPLPGAAARGTAVVDLAAGRAGRHPARHHRLPGSAGDRRTRAETSSRRRRPASGVAVPNWVGDPIAGVRAEAHPARPGPGRASSRAQRHRAGRPRHLDRSGAGHDRCSGATTIPGRRSAPARSRCRCRT